MNHHYDEAKEPSLIPASLFVSIYKLLAPSITGKVLVSLISLNLMKNGNSFLDISEMPHMQPI